MLKTNHVHFKIDQLSTRQSYDHLSLVDSTFGDVLFPMCLPLIDTFVSFNVTDTLRVYLIIKCKIRISCTEVQTCKRASSPSWWAAKVGVVPRNPEFVISSTVSPMERTRVAFVKETII